MKVKNKRKQKSIILNKSKSKRKINEIFSPEGKVKGSEIKKVESNTTLHESSNELQKYRQLLMKT
jgi:hypothetical protein